MNRLCRPAILHSDTIEVLKKAEISDKTTSWPETFNCPQMS